nr:translation initiation factor IF-2-like [Oryctolagus cuniculus]
MSQSALRCRLLCRLPSQPGLPSSPPAPEKPPRAATPSVGAPPREPCPSQQWKSAGGHRLPSLQDHGTQGFLGSPVSLAMATAPETVKHWSPPPPSPAVPAPPPPPPGSLQQAEGSSHGLPPGLCGWLWARVGLAHSHCQETEQVRSLPEQRKHKWAPVHGWSRPPAPGGHSTDVACVTVPGARRPHEETSAEGLCGGRRLVAGKRGGRMAGLRRPGWRQKQDPGELSSTLGSGTASPCHGGRDGGPGCHPEEHTQEPTSLPVPLRSSPVLQGRSCRPPQGGGAAPFPPCYSWAGKELACPVHLGSPLQPQAPLHVVLLAPHSSAASPSRSHLLSLGTQDRGSRRPQGELMGWDGGAAAERPLFPGPSPLPWEPALN